MQILWASLSLPPFPPWFSLPAHISGSWNAGLPIILPRENEPVLLGAAILGAVAAKKHAGLHDAMRALNAAGQVCNWIPERATCLMATGWLMKLYFNYVFFELSRSYSELWWKY